MSAPIEKRHRDAAEAFAGPEGPRHSLKPAGARWRGLANGYAQALADQEAEIADWLGAGSDRRRRRWSHTFDEAARRLRSGEWKGSE